MKHIDYEIELYRPEQISEVSEVQKGLYGLDESIVAEYFRWKYQQNPCDDKALGVVAIHENKIVGFRGYFASKWQVGDTENSVVLLSSSDVCVSPEHRKKGLFGAMTELFLNEYSQSNYGGYINLSSNQYSTPGDIKKGWIKIACRKELRYCRLAGLIKYMLVQKAGLKLKGFNLKFGRFGNIEVTDKPNPEAMVSVFKKQTQGSNKLTLLRDVDFFKWQFRNNLKKYIFCYFWKGEEITGYMVLAICCYCPENTNKAAIIDFAQVQEGALDKIIRHIINENWSNVFDVWNYDPEDSFVSGFRDHGFSSDNLTIKAQQHLRGERYLLVRPIRKNFNENDWFIHDLDIRNVKNWDIKEICSDDA